MLDPEHAGVDPYLGAAAAARLAGSIAQSAFLIGVRADRQVATALGALAMPWSGFAGGVRSVRALRLAVERHLDRLPITERDAPVVLALWSSRVAALLAGVRWSRPVAIMAMLTSGPRPSDLRRPLWPYSGTGLGKLRAACFDSAVAAAWSRQGVMAPMVLATPLLEDSRWRPGRDACRAALGIRPGELAVALLNDPPNVADARMFTWVCGAMTISDRPCVGLLPAAAMGLRRAARYLRQHRREWEIIPYAGPMTAALSAADFAIWEHDPARLDDECPQPGGSRLLAAHATLHGLPIIAVTTPTTRDVLAAAPPWCRVGSATMPAFAAAALVLGDDAALRGRVGAVLTADSRSRAPTTNAEFADGLRRIVSFAAAAAIAGCAPSFAAV
ncbi:hypothetical protein BH11PLA1_BH11PLA1_04170 [soil metagenome]